ncbi:pentatricopeptide repeat-containing protein At4g33170 [Dioscorea cayenensis subsp. rotundata]|uniref:Pentatricopeptide repeat-containing protein At4g33170 n=1 Tax=Dioscorea cayennensis subsp. rotundata TaxID=55577 RepID=A0AB40BDB0_DIOCR|nr:pentatricopeptide repeat-containing protein At4g33170 [Dioscorea cayenensis subsp. rotundata]
MALASSSSSSAWFPLLRTATFSGDLYLGKLTHARIIISGVLPDVFLSNNLITLYSRCNSLHDARSVFDQMPHRDFVSFNSLLSAYALHNHFLPALHLLRLMLRCSPSLPTSLSLSPVLKLCSLSPDFLPSSLSIHSLAVRSGLESDFIVSSSFINVYSKNGLVVDARRVFDVMPYRDVVLWNVMIKGYVQMGLHKDAFLMFSELHRSESLQADDFSVQCVLEGGEPSSFVEQVRSFGLKKCLLSDAIDVISWNKKMSGNSKAGELMAVIDCFVSMRRLDVGYDNVTFVIAISAVARFEGVDVGRQIHGLVLKHGFCKDVSVSNSLINMYAKMGIWDSAKKVFEAMEELDLISWNSMISSSVQNGFTDESVVFFLDMLRHSVVPDQFTMASILQACSVTSREATLHEMLHCYALKTDLVKDDFVLAALIDVYSKKGSMKEAELLLREMDWFDIVSFNALIAGYVSNNDDIEALELFSSMQRNGEKANNFTLATIFKACSDLVAFEEGRQIHAHSVKLGLDSDLCVSSGMLDTYIKCGNIDDASAVFSEIREPDDVAWTTMISGFVENGQEDCALNLFHQMRRSGPPADEFILASLAKACSCLAALEQGRQIHANAIKLDHALDTFVGTSMMDMYAKCGNIDDSYQLFKSMSVKSIASWNVMVLGFAQHGNGKQALDLFRQMIVHGVRPDKITFIAVLSACSHSGLVSEAYKYFNSMQTDYGIKPEIEHYSCLVDALGRVGLVSEAEKVIETMPFNASASMYRALLGACRIQGNMDIGKKVATKILELEPFDPSAFVLLSNIYAAANQWDKVKDARKRMKGSNVMKDPGYSWIELKNKMHLFTVDDKSHPETAAIYNELEDLIRRIKDEGYVPDTEFVLLDVEEEEKEKALNFHSEKLAIAYGLISTPSPQRIRVIKNLRVCGDCHNAIKFISKVTAREIVLRDANRFHCFKDGVCSCGDFW